MGIASVWRPLRSFFEDHHGMVECPVWGLGGPEFILTSLIISPDELFPVLGTSYFA